MTGAALSACAGWLARLQLEGLLILGLCFALDRGARRRSAAARRGIWALGVATLLLLPLPRLLLPTSTPALPQLASALALALWLAGAALLLRRLARGVARARRYVQNASPMPEGAWTATLASLLRPGAPVAVALRVTDELDGPAAIGALRPVILVPRALLGASPERRRSMLAHELAHVARADGLVLLAGALVRALFWITPLSWWALSRLRAVAEDAADDAVLGAGVRSSSYAALLVELARARGSSARAGAARAACGTGCARSSTWRAGAARSRCPESHAGACRGSRPRPRCSPAR
ncbi:MAG: M56 family metallopeptidase [Myxococcales bacterium]|nr:M56 family metallopeptidase [Myxococcales bacterium]